MVVMVTMPIIEDLSAYVANKSAELLGNALESGDFSAISNVSSFGMFFEYNS
jgi:hypothetical protein